MSGNNHVDPLDLLSLQELSKLTKRSVRSLREDIAAGRLHAVKLGNSTRIPRAEAERFVYQGSTVNG